MSDVNTAAAAAPATPNTPAPNTPASNTAPVADSGSQHEATDARNEKGQFTAKNPTQPHQQNQTADAKKQEAAAKALARKLKLKVDGREEELPEEEVVKWAQMGRAAQKRFQEASEKRKQAEDFIRMLKEDPISVLSNPAIGVDFRKLAEEYLSKELQRETLSPEQKRIQELEDELRKRDDERKKGEEQKRQEEFQKLQQHYADDFDRKITGALQDSGLPKSPKTVKRMADYMVMALEQGIDLEPRDVVELVRQDYITEVSDLFSQTDGDALLKILGEGVANKIRKADLARLRSANPSPITPQVQQQQQKEEPESKVKQPKNIYEWREEIERRVKS